MSAALRRPSVLQSKTLLPAEFISAAQFFFPGPPPNHDLAGIRWNDAKTAEEHARVKHGI